LGENKNIWLIGNTWDEGQLQIAVFKDGLYRKAALKF